ncbi:hypothetical protein K2X30_00030 [bacterium]|nr:hypothetical protein [bacterium]
MFTRKSIASLMLVVFGLQISGCNGIKSLHIDEDYSSLVTALRQEARKNSAPAAKERLDAAIRLQAKVKTAEKKVVAFPKLEGKLTANPDQAKQWIRTNRAAIEQYLGSVETEINEVGKEVFELSKKAYHTDLVDSSMRDNVLVYFGLQYYKNVVNHMMQTGGPLLFAVGTESFNKDPELQEFRKMLLDRYFGFLGLGMVVDSDLAKVEDLLNQAVIDKRLPDSIADILKNSQRHVKSFAKNQGQTQTQALSKLSKQEKAAIAEKVLKLKEEFAKQTLLYTPGANHNALVKMLVVLGNLTWGLVNTLIGVTIVVATMVVSPFTEYVDFPSFRVASNGMQIYVNVTGMSPIAGKMSMGLFELDNASGYDFASAHEGGHAIQSAILGPFYLPVVLATYLVSGFDQGIMEEWATLMAD